VSDWGSSEQSRVHSIRRQPVMPCNWGLNQGLHLLRGRHPGLLVALGCSVSLGGAVGLLLWGSLALPLLLGLPAPLLLGLPVPLLLGLPVPLLLGLPVLLLRLAVLLLGLTVLLLGLIIPMQEHSFADLKAAAL